MKTQNHTSIARAICTAELADTSIAISGVDGWRMLLPAGHFRARDGRPFEPALKKGWFIDASIAQKLIEQVRQDGEDVLVDYEHQTLYTQQNGKQAPAAGWYNADELQWFDGTEQIPSGLYINPRWTTTAQSQLSENQYRRLSAVFDYDKKTGHPTKIIMTALTNYPALRGMEELVALSAQFYKPFESNNQENNPMNEHVQALMSALGIEFPPDNELTPELATAALTAIETLKAEKETAVVALSANATPLQSIQAHAVPDLTQFVPIKNYNAIRDELAVLTAQHGVISAEQLIAQGRKEGRVIAAEEDFLQLFAQQQGVVALKTVIDARPPIHALIQTQTVDEPQQTGTATLTADQKEAARLLGKTHAEYLEALKLSELEEQGE